MMLPSWISKKISFQGLIRLLADAVLINVATITGLAARLLYIVAYGNPDANINYRETLWQYLDYFEEGFWLLTLICLTVFFLSGFYTYGRFYQGRFKFLVLVQAVTISYLVFGFAIYFFKVNFPRSTVVLSWGLSLLLLSAARAWSFLWKRVVNIERILIERPEDRRINLVLVIGGAGYIGSAFLPKLLEKGYRVRLLDLLLYGTEPIQELLHHPHLEIMQADFRQIDKVVEAMQNVDAVIHLGGIVGDPASALDEELTVDINLIATRMIAEVAKGSGVGHFIFASSCSVYGASEEKLNERSSLHPVSLYARSKIASEKVLMSMADDHFAPVTLRFGTIYGLSGRTRFDLVVNLLTAQAVFDREIHIYGGDQWRPFLHVGDAARAILMALEAPRNLVSNQVFNVGSSEQNYTIRQIGKIIESYVPEATMVENMENADLRNYWVDFSKIHDTLSFAPEWTVEGGVQQVINAIQSGKVSDYRDAKYSNVKFLTEEGIFRLERKGEGWAYQLLNEESK
jgi:nucleoside-diphosphate-sugar epimerase